MRDLVATEERETPSATPAVVNSRMTWASSSGGRSGGGGGAAAAGAAGTASDMATRSNGRYSVGSLVSQDELTDKV